MSDPTIRTVARQRGIDINTLIKILSVRRPADSDGEQQFVMRFLDPIPGMCADDYGNRYLVIGDKPTVMWSCHTDTVSAVDGLQNVRWKGDMLELNGGQRGQCLGADDGAGLWLMLEMIKAGKPGLYIFHRDEEIGGIGSKDIAKNRPELVNGIQMAIAFDRKSTHSVITYQRGKRCCSDLFGQSLADALNLTHPNLDYKLDETGVFTDTASYTTLIPECTNLSVGYYQEHTESESLDVRHLVRLRDAVLALDVSTLPISRDPTVVEHRSYGGYSGYYGGYDYHGYGSTAMTTMGNAEDVALAELATLLSTYPRAISRFLLDNGMTAEKLEDAVWPRDPAKPLVVRDEVPDDDEDGDTEEQLCIVCETCGECTPSAWLRDEPEDGDPCPQCDSKETTVDYYEVNIFSGELVCA